MGPIHPVWGHVLMSFFENGRSWTKCKSLQAHTQTLVGHTLYGASLLLSSKLSFHTNITGWPRAMPCHVMVSRAMTYFGVPCHILACHCVPYSFRVTPCQYFREIQKYITNPETHREYIVFETIYVYPSQPDPPPPPQTGGRGAGGGGGPDWPG